MITAVRSTDSLGGSANRVLDMRSRRRLSPAPVDTWEVHGYENIGANSIRIRVRSIRIHQVANILIDDQTVHLAGTACWVYAQIVRASPTSATIVTAAVEPVSDEGYLNIPLYYFTLHSLSQTYSLSQSGKWDVNIDSTVGKPT